MANKKYKQRLNFLNFASNFDVNCHEIIFLKKTCKFIKSNNVALLALGSKDLVIFVV
jgi:hypothetical protein